MSLDILNIKEVVSRASEEGLRLSEYTVRRAIRSGQLPCRIVGRTYLISWDNVIRWLTCAGNNDTEIQK